MVYSTLTKRFQAARPEPLSWLEPTSLKLLPLVHWQGALQNNSSPGQKCPDQLTNGGKETDVYSDKDVINWPSHEPSLWRVTSQD